MRSSLPKSVCGDGQKVAGVRRLARQLKNRHRAKIKAASIEIPKHSTC
jgi:hypothetical protein